MKIEKTNYGLSVQVNNESPYRLRQVKTLNSCFTRHHPSINDLDNEEKILTRKFLLLAWSYENTIKSCKNYRDFNRWNNHNRNDFNVYYYEQLRQLSEKINCISIRYSDNCLENYPYGGYSYAL